jgi:outer membrane protein
MAKYFFSKTLAVLSLFLATLLPQLLQAQIRPMTLDEVVSLGLGNSRQLQVSAAKVAAAQAKIAQYRDQFVPSLTYTGSYYRLSDNVTPLETPLFTVPVLLNQTQNRFSLSETVFTGFRAKNTIEAGTFLANAARYDADRDKADVKINLISATLNLYKLQEARKVFDRSLATSRNRQTDLNNLRTQGLALDNDVLKAELAIAQLESAQAETDNAIRAAQFSIAVLCDLSEGTDIQIDSTSIFASQEYVADINEYLAGAPNTATVRAAQERSAAAAKQVSISKGIMLPLISVGANYYYNNPNQRQFPTVDKFIGTWDAGVGVTWNLSSFYTSRHSVEESRANQIQSEALGVQLRDAARNDIAANFYNWQTARNKISVADKSVLSAMENQRINQLRQVEQVASATDLLEADALLLQSQINAVTSRVDARSAWYRLQKSAGRL